MKRVLITGKTGFIGSKLKGKKFEGRVTSYKKLLVQTKNVKGIVHLAAKANRRRCEENPKEAIETNLIGLCNVLEVALKRGLWVLFVSTFQVRDRNLYGLTKLIGEELCKLYEEKGVDVKIIRLPIVYGPNDNPDKVVTKILNEIKAGKTPKINTTNRFYFAYVNDVIKAIENEVDIFNGSWGKKYSLTDLVNGVRKCLHEEKK